MSYEYCIVLTVNSNGLLTVNNAKYIVLQFCRHRCRVPSFIQ